MKKIETPLRQTGPPRARFALLRGDKFAVEFEFDRIFVSGIKALHTSRWNAKERRWEGHLLELAEAARALGVQFSEVPEEVRSAYGKKWRLGPVRVRVGPVEAQLTGGPIPLAEIDRATSFEIPGYRFSPAFKSGRWDGRRRLLSLRTFKFPSGLWPRVRGVLEQQGLTWEVDEAAAPETQPVGIREPPTKLRDYQAEILDEALRAGRGVVQLATGGGKTLLAAHLLHRLDRSAFFFVHTRDLLYQAARVFERELGGPIGLLGDGHLELGAVTVATIQTAARVFEIAEDDDGEKPGAEEESEQEKPTDLLSMREEIARAMTQASVIIFDECHHVPAESSFRLAAKLKNAAHRFGLSATPWRDDNRDLLLEACLGAKICSVTCSDLIERGYLVAPEIKFKRVAGASDAGRSRRRSYQDIYRAEIVENDRRNLVIAEEAKREIESGRSVLILVTQVRHGERLLELLPEARLTQGRLDTATRRQYLEDFESKRNPLLIATTLADEGLDIPSLEVVILAGAGKSATKAYQRIGRALRPFKNKKIARIIDFMDRGKYLEDHAAERLRIYRNEPAFRVKLD